MRQLIIFLLLCCCLTSDVFAGVILYWPNDKQITFKRVVELAGVGKDLQLLKINGHQMRFDENGSFSCGLVLKPGKNYVNIRVLDENQGHFVNSLRILNLTTFPDLEILYDGRKHWARNQIVYLASLGFIEGHPDGYYYPGRPITRGELATWIARIKKLKLPVLTEDVFRDVPKEHWRAPYIKAIVDMGFMTGYDMYTFGIEDPISRREAAEVAMVSEGLGVAEKIRPLFIDVPKEEKGAFPIYVGKQRGMLKGVYDDIPVYDPDRALTRAEAAMLLARFRNALQKVRELFDFTRGYAESQYCDLNVYPQIVTFTIDPWHIPARERYAVRLRAKIERREIFSPIANVKVDLTDIGGMPDTEMFDDGSHGDEESGDLTYSLNIMVEPKKSGEKFLELSVVDELGWESKKKSSLYILE